ncbi:MAG: hypothetical protein B7Z15_07100 [Rhizobiales bacterium 32-66-8]|nr:MAG: hypothetical protein B7Z15_07100 [Rhizobiales bacterium 32-66-8]
MATAKIIPLTPGKPRGRVIPVEANRILSTDIFQESRVVVITHGDATYHLRLTAQDKLILTK